MKRAAIYIRVSSEAQGEKASPKEQEADCLDYCQNHGYPVFDVYRDVDKYRVGGKTVEPSATRSDRPQLKRMLADGDAGQFDVIIAWREDRLYRGCTLAMVNLNDRVKKGTFGIELVKEFYDPKTAAVKAWAAGVELEAKHDRLMMGGKALFKAGKVWNQRPPYGYVLEDGKYLVNEIEAAWLVKIFQWYGAGATGRDIRKQLIGANAPQRKGGKYPWQVGYIYRLLKYETYSTGIFTMEWDRTKHEIPVPVIIPPEVAEAVNTRFARYKEYPAGNLTALSLVSGLVFCKTCGTRMQVKRIKGRIYYRCNVASFRGDAPGGCAKARRMDAIDGDVWTKLWNLISEPGEFEAALAKKIDELHAQEMDVEAECERIERELMNLASERQKVITWARKDIITDDDLQIQVGTLDLQENELQRELADKRLLTGNRAEQLLEAARIYRAQVKTGYDVINAVPVTEHQAELQFQFRRKIIDAIVERVDIDHEKCTEIYTVFDFGKNISTSTTNRWSESATTPGQTGLIRCQPARGPGRSK
jgi:site-specific DNA recombinase